MSEVIDVPFEEIAIQVSGVYVGSFSGSAGIDSDGAVCSLVLDGLKDGTKSYARLAVPPRHTAEPGFANALAHKLALEIEFQLAGEIREALSDWEGARKVREAAE
jgi:hypothetical protein